MVTLLLGPPGGILDIQSCRFEVGQVFSFSSQSRRWFLPSKTCREFCLPTARTKQKSHHKSGDSFTWPARRDSNPRPLESESTAISSFATGGYRRTTKSTRSLYTETAANARGNFRFFDFLQKHAPITANGMDFHGFGAKAVPIIPRDSCRRRRFSDGSEIF